MVGLGELGARQGDLDSARAWLQAAIDTGHPEAAREARRELDRIAAAADEQRRAELYARARRPSPRERPDEPDSSDPRGRV